jgi:hypothetical protein
LETDFAEQQPESKKGCRAAEQDRVANKDSRPFPFSQIMNLLSLAPSIQEEILCLSAVETREDKVHAGQ